MSALIWITGLAGSGKSTLAREVYTRLKRNFPNSVLLDGDEFREVLGADVGYDAAGRMTNAWRIARMCRLLCSQQINVVCATMSLYSEIHDYNRKNNSGYFEIFVDTHMDELISRDQKNLYTKALKGDIKNVIGVDQPYDKPKNPDLVLKNFTRDEVPAIAADILSKCKLN